MKIINRREARRRTANGLIKYLGGETLELQGHHASIRECTPNVLEAISSREIGKKADYLAIGKPTNIIGSGNPKREYSRVHVDYYSKKEGEYD